MPERKNNSVVVLLTMCLVSPCVVKNKGEKRTEGDGALLLTVQESGGAPFLLVLNTCRAQE